MLAGVEAVHTDMRVAGPQSKINDHRSTKVRDDEGWRETVSTHPVIRTHPETEKKCLFLNRVYVSHLKNMTIEESRPLLEYLYQHQSRPDFTCRFRWKKGAVAF